MMTLLHIRYVYRSPRDVVQKKQENVLRPIWEPVVRGKKDLRTLGTFLVFTWELAVIKLIRHHLPYCKTCFSTSE